MWKAASKLIDQIRGRVLPDQHPGLNPWKLRSGSGNWKWLCEKAGYRFSDLHLLDQALTHSSYSYEQEASNPGKSVPNYESLEFLGDSILGLVISEFLFLSYPDKREGFLSKIKSQLVSTSQLSVLSRTTYPW